MANLTVIAEGELATVLSFWLSRFMLPYGKEIIRPEIFTMVVLKPSG